MSDSETSIQLEDETESAANKVLTVGQSVLRYGIVVVVGYVGLLKFTSYEAEGVEPFGANNPLMSWMYSLFSVQTAAEILGSWEIISAVLIACRPRSAKASAVGSVMVMIQALTTLSCIFTTPGVWHEERGFPFMTASPGQFLVKDIVLLGGAIWTLGEALQED